MVSGHPGRPFMWALLVAGDGMVVPGGSRAGSRAPARSWAVGEGALPRRRDRGCASQQGPGWDAGRSASALRG